MRQPQDTRQWLKRLWRAFGAEPRNRQENPLFHHARPKSTRLRMESAPHRRGNRLLV